LSRVARGFNHFGNHNIEGALGQSSRLHVMPEGSYVHPMLRRRSAGPPQFLSHYQLSVTPQAPPSVCRRPLRHDERWLDTLGAWTARDRPIASRHCRWYYVGFHHITRMETGPYADPLFGFTLIRTISLPPIRR